MDVFFYQTCWLFSFEHTRFREPPVCMYSHVLTILFIRKFYENEISQDD